MMIMALHVKETSNNFFYSFIYLLLYCHLPNLNFLDMH